MYKYKRDLCKVYLTSGTEILLYRYQDSDGYYIWNNLNYVEVEAPSRDFADVLDTKLIYTDRLEFR